jgi:hypothetical protein
MDLQMYLQIKYYIDNVLDGRNKWRDKWTRAAGMVKYHVNGGEGAGGLEASGEEEEKEMRWDEMR